MIGERQREAVLERRLWQLAAALEEERAIALEGEFVRIELAKAIDQRGLAMKIGGIAAGITFDGIDPDRGSRPRLGRQISGLRSFQGLDQAALAQLLLGYLEDQSPQCQ